jgi:hypothetical protein
MHKALTAISSHGCYVTTANVVEQLQTDLRSRFPDLNANTIAKRLNNDKDGLLQKYYRGEVKNKGTWGLPNGPVDFAEIFQDNPTPFV